MEGVFFERIVGNTINDVPAIRSGTVSTTIRVIFQRSQLGASE